MKVLIAYLVTRQASFGIRNPFVHCIHCVVHWTVHDLFVPVTQHFQATLLRYLGCTSLQIWKNVSSGCILQSFLVFLRSLAFYCHSRNTLPHSVCSRPSTRVQSAKHFRCDKRWFPNYCVPKCSFNQIIYSRDAIPLSFTSLNVTRSTRAQYGTWSDQRVYIPAVACRVMITLLCCHI